MATVITANAPEIRVEGRDKVSGRTRYTADVRLPDTLWAAFTESPVAHARIVEIDVTAARSMPGVRAILTATDIGVPRLGRQLYDWPVLASEVVRFIGDRVVAVAAETREAAESAARAVEVRYEALPVVLDAEAALAPDAPVLHPEWDRYPYPVFDGRERPPRAHPNVQGTRRFAKGATELEPFFRSAAHVFEHRFTTPRQHAGYLEPKSTIVWIDDAGIVHVHSPNKSPFALRDQLARTLGIERERIVVECSSIGGDFGGKGLTIDEFSCYYLARATGRPVRHVQSYADELRSSQSRHRATVSLRTAVDRDGRFVAHRGRVLYDGGAYAAGKPIPTLLPGFGFGTVPYGVPNAQLEATAVYTNTAPAGHVRGPGEFQTFFAWEAHVDMIAAELGIDPLELRLRNVMSDGETAVTNDAMHHPMGRHVLQRLRDELASRPPLAPSQGRGIALVCSHTGGGRTGVRMRLDPDGVITVMVGVADQGAGSFTLVQRVAAAALAVDPSRIVVRQGNTSDALTDPGAGASRVSHIVGRATEAAATKLQALIDEQGSDEPLEVDAAFDSDPPGSKRLPDYTFGALATEVAVDPETGAVTLLDAVLVADFGPVINPLAHAGQLEGGFAYGLGNSLMEELPLDESGRMVAQSLGEYKLPTIRDVPRLRTIAVEAPTGQGPQGAKMVGELVNSAVAGAIGNAIAAAVGVRLCELPFTAERIHSALHKEPA